MDDGGYSAEDAQKQATELSLAKALNDRYRRRVEAVIQWANAYNREDDTYDCDGFAVDFDELLSILRGKRDNA